MTPFRKPLRTPFHAPLCRRRPSRLLAIFAAAALLLTLRAARAEWPFVDPPINYLKAPVTDPIARLQQRIDSGKTRLESDDKHGYLAAVLRELKVPVSSQMLVFSQTSFQRTRISPQTPRALYFNDDIYVGWVQGGDVLEFSAADPRQGAVFYLLSQAKADKPIFRRQTYECLECHASYRTADVPGHLLRSVFADSNGMPLFSAGTFDIDQTSPLKQRWGGWYVTGKSGRQTHMGNSIVKNPDHPDQLDMAAGANVTDLSNRLDTSPYLTGHSDIVALMVLEHQTRMHNLITQAGYEARMAVHYDVELNKALDRPAGYRSEATDHRIQAAAEALVSYMLFVGETRLEEPIEGTSGFAQEFAKRGPRDGHGRSLRDFDLKRRLFKYPLSYLIYSDPYENLSPEMKRQVERRLWEVLSGQDKTERFAHLTAADRRAILEILLETKPGLPDYWKAGKPR